MKPLEIRGERRGRLHQQSRILQKIDEKGRRVSDTDGPVLDLERAPLVLEEAGVPPTLSGATLASSRFGAVDEVRSWYQGVLQGTSQTYLAVLQGDDANYTGAALARNAVKRGVTISWYSWHNFATRSTDNLTRYRMLSGVNAEEQAEAAQEVYAAEAEERRLSYVYELLVLVDFDINDVVEFTVPDISALLRTRSDWGVATVVTMQASAAAALSQEASRFGPRGSLLRLLSDDGEVFDGRQ